MSGLNVYDNRRAVMVKPLTAATFNYGFLTNVRAAISSELGHDPATGSTVVFGANAPKPGRATKREATGSVSSFYDITLRETLRSLGYRVTAPRIRSGRKTRHTETVYVTINGIKYAWQMPDWKRAKIGADFDALGLKVGTNADKDLVFGARTVGGSKPPTATKTVIGQDGEDSVSTIYDPSVTLPTGWGATITGEQGS